LQILENIFLEEVTYLEAIMDNQRTYFYGCVLGFILMSIRVPAFFFWVDIIEHVDFLFQFCGFVLLVICSIPLIFDILKTFKRY